jgi:hypothetical protein
MGASMERIPHGAVRIKLKNRMMKPVQLEGLYDRYDFIELVHKMRDKVATEMV